MVRGYTFGAHCTVHVCVHVRVCEHIYTRLFFYKNNLFTKKTGKKYNADMSLQERRQEKRMID
jgi:hypothetical protein